MAKDLINVFVSHYHKDEDNIKRMKDLLGVPMIASGLIGK